MSEAPGEAPVAEPAKPRQPWLAALLSLAWPGLGQIYNGEARRAFVCFAMLSLLFVLAAVLLPIIAAPQAFLAFSAALMAAALALSIGAAIDAFRHARRLGRVPPKGYQRGWVYLGIVALWLGATEGLAWVAGPHGGCSPEVPSEFSHLYRIPGGSMRPTVYPGEIVVASTRYFCRNDPRRGDLALFLRPNKGGTIWVKRIIGLPGDKVQIKEGRVYVNGEAVAQEWLESGIDTDESGEGLQWARFVESFPDGARYVVEIADLGAPLENTPEVTVPADGYFMLGDERDNSMDSRMSREFGFIPRALIVDRPAYVVWSDDWDRFGLRLR
jgi:signal peptidase I